MAGSNYLCCLPCFWVLCFYCFAAALCSGQGNVGGLPGFYSTSFVSTE